MANDRAQGYRDDDNDAHVDTRHFSQECEKPDPNLGCNLGIDVAG
jgi:hypothetical protein